MESITVNFFPYVAAITSGASDDPPIPQRTTFDKLLLLAQADKASNCGNKSLELFGKSIQPNLLMASVFLPHNV